jgi:hypothetical protein
MKQIFCGCRASFLPLLGLASRQEATCFLHAAGRKSTARKSRSETGAAFRKNLTNSAIAQNHKKSASSVKIR